MVYKITLDTDTTHRAVDSNGQTEDLALNKLLQKCAEIRRDWFLSDNALVANFTYLRPLLIIKFSHLQLLLFFINNISNNIQGTEYKRQHQK